MNLSSDILQDFADIVYEGTTSNAESSVYGTVHIQNERVFVRIDGASVDTPAVYTADVKEGDRVLVTLRNRQAIITGNVSNPSGEPSGYSALIENVSQHISDTSKHLTDAEKTKLDAMQPEQYSTKSETVISITRSGNTFTATRADGTTFTFDQNDFAKELLQVFDYVDTEIAKVYAGKGAAGGFASLDENGKLPLSQLSLSLISNAEIDEICQEVS